MIEIDDSVHDDSVHWRRNMGNKRVWLEFYVENALSRVQQDITLSQLHVSNSEKEVESLQASQAAI